jgi:hypothetical protein
MNKRAGKARDILTCNLSRTQASHHRSTYFNKMRIAIIIAGLAALAYAAPYPQVDESPDDGFPDDESPDEDEGPEIISTLFPTPTLSIILTTSLNIPVTPIVPRPGMPTTSGKKSHWEPIPIFTKKCECNVATVRYPCWATDALQVST